MDNPEAMIVSILSRSLVAGTPLLLATLGEVVAERAGVMNLGVEGMMAVGAVTGFGVALHTGNPWLGLAAAMLAGLVLSALHAFFTVLLQAGQIVSGLALTTLGLGLSGLIGKAFIGTPLKTHFEILPIPLLERLPIVGPGIFRLDPVCYLSVILGGVFWFLLFQTRWGILVRSAGEYPAATEAMGAPVRLIRVLCVLIGGAMAGAAGGYLSLAYSPSWIEGMTAGRGWIVIALTIFAAWNPLKAFLGAYLFGGVYVSQYFMQNVGIPPNFLLMLPYVVTLLALMIGSCNLRRGAGQGPAALGIPW